MARNTPGLHQLRVIQRQGSGARHLCFQSLRFQCSRQSSQGIRQFPQGGRYTAIITEAKPQVARARVTGAWAKAEAGMFHPSSPQLLSGFIMFGWLGNGLQMFAGAIHMKGYTVTHVGGTKPAREPTSTESPRALQKSMGYE